MTSSRCPNSTIRCSLPPFTTTFATTAFTLIELLTVIAIIGILAGILIPVTGRVRDSARTAQCASNMRQLAQSMLLYAEDNRGVLPKTYSTPDGHTIGWWEYLYPDYCAPKDVFACPADQTPFNGTGSFVRDGKTLSDGKVSYGIPGLQGDDGFKAANKPLTRFSNPSRMCLITDSYADGEERRLSKPWYSTHPQYLLRQQIAQIPFSHSRGEKANFAFLDGHVVLMSKTEMSTAYEDRKYNFGHFAPW
ncbi:prepilin-type N-terminal cleavage/methylation domain-containing protein [Opitutaceae bacterium TAV4]|nr:prepilin-type N-terminal cleavage/methylation domain-containing protein [Opitutaceae bacterium TAV4]RRJ99570.1 prepilin-type N-terminal cleavage/methylation domain-containing protein [Opitutaceae bacterium TAV3]